MSELNAACLDLRCLRRLITKPCPHHAIPGPTQIICQPLTSTPYHFHSQLQFPTPISPLPGTFGKSLSRTFDKLLLMQEA